jgi:DNA polymerase III subunit epsilon
MEASRGTARAAAIRWAATIAADPRTVYLDTETTGFGRSAEIVDIAIVDAAGQTLLDCLVRPQGPIPPEASAIHGIHADHVAGAPAWPEVYREAVVLLSGRPVVVYNAAYDAGIVLGCCDRHGLPQPTDHRGWQCAMIQYASYRGEPNARGRGFRWHKLDVAVRDFGAQPGGHRALGDALACRTVVLGMAGPGAAEEEGQGQRPWWRIF